MAATKTKKANIEKLNETGNRNPSERRHSNSPVKQTNESASQDSNDSMADQKEDQEIEQVTSEAPERRKVQRRRQIDPTTCERDYTNVEIEFMQALDEYKRENGRMFPTCSEILEVILKLGYVKMDGSTLETESVIEFDPNAEQDELAENEEEQFV